MIEYLILDIFPCTFKKTDHCVPPRPYYNSLLGFHYDWPVAAAQLSNTGLTTPKVEGSNPATAVGNGERTDKKQGKELPYAD
jgi:hypothetical protein